MTVVRINKTKVETCEEVSFSVLYFMKIFLKENFHDFRSNINFSFVFNDKNNEQCLFQSHYRFNIRKQKHAWRKLC